MRLTLDEIKTAVCGVLYNDKPSSYVCGVSTDSRNVGEGELFVALKGDRFDGHDFIADLPRHTGAVLCEKELETELPYIVVSDTYKALGTLSAYYKGKLSLKAVIGVTGSVGKTTTKEFIAGVLKTTYKTHYTRGNFNNHIGLPLTVCDANDDTEALVCEMGMSSQGEISYLSTIARPDIGVVTNIGVSHIEILGSREKIRDAKLEIVDGMSCGTLIVDGDEPLLNDENARERMALHKVIRVGFSSSNDYYPCDIYKGSDRISFDVVYPNGEDRVTIPVVGDHFIKNALVAFAVGIECDVKVEDIKKGLSSYEPQGLRQRIYVKDGVRIIADCYNASPESMKASLSVLGESEGRKIAVLGDMLELGEYSKRAHHDVGASVAEIKADMLFCFGNEAREIKVGAVSNGFAEDKALCYSDAEALALKLKETVMANDTVLFKASRRMKLENIIEIMGFSE